MCPSPAPSLHAERVTPMTSAHYESPWMNEETRIFRGAVRRFIEKELAPHQGRWAEQGRPDRDAWIAAGKTGLLLPDVPDQYGGGGGSFAHEAVVVEELARAGLHIGFGIQSIVAHYILAYGGEEQKHRWLPGLARGEVVAAIGMTEPQSGSDLTAIRTRASREGDRYVVNGAKTFITNGSYADLVCLAVRTDPTKPGPKALSLLMLETKDLPGYRVGRPLAKIGRPAQDTCELFFEDVRAPVDNLLGAAEGHGLFQMMDQLRYERLSIALGAVAVAERAIEITARQVKERTAHGKPLLELQNTRFALAESKTEAHIGRIFVDHCIQQFIAGRLDAVSASMAKYWLTECECRIVDACVQLHGGYGYMREYPIGPMLIDSRAQRIYAGSNEVIKELIGRSI